MSASETAPIMDWTPRDHWSAITHLAGLLLAVIGTIYLLLIGYKNGGVLYLTAFAVYGISMILLYLASTLYHWLQINARGILILRKFDHSMIYVLIAGSYTPLCLIALSGGWRIGLLSGIWLIAIGGILLTIFYFSAPRWLTTSIYIFMGWLALAAIFPLSQTLPAAGFFWLIVGGLFYTAGGIIYGIKPAALGWAEFGFHEIFHLFVLAGSACHYLLMLLVLARM